MPNNAFERTVEHRGSRLSAAPPSWPAAQRDRSASRTQRRKMSVAMNFEIECEREDDGRWLAEVPQLPGVLAYGTSANDAMAKAQILALRVLAERLENSETGPQAITFSIAA
jgi:predicted RNase H-like HicB family nuclease